MTRSAASMFTKPCECCGTIPCQKPDAARVRELEDPLVGADCSLCDATADNFHVPDELWERVGLGNVQACFKCFRIAAWHAGVRTDANWEVRLGSTTSSGPVGSERSLEAGRGPIRKDGLCTGSDSPAANVPGSGGASGLTTNPFGGRVNPLGQGGRRLTNPDGEVRDTKVSA